MTANGGNLTIVPSGAPLAAEVKGLELSRDQPGETILQLIRAFEQHQVLVFRDQRLSNERQLEVSEWFGPRYAPPGDLPVLGDESQPPVVAISNFAEGGLLGDMELGAHSDLQFMPVPLLGAMLHAVEVPVHGGETSWSNLYQAYEELPAATRSEIAGLQVYAFNPYAGRGALRDLAGPNQKYMAGEAPPFYHPLVRTHPATGRKSLFCSQLSTAIAGWDAEQSAALLKSLRAHVDQDHLYYHHKWRPGDVVLWDNRCTNHKRTAIKPGERRLLYRVQIAGSKPF